MEASQPRELEYESRRALSLLAQAEAIAQIGSWEFVVSTQEVFWSDNCYRLFGVEPGDVRPSIEYLIAATHPDDRERVARAVRAMRDEAWGTSSVDYRITRPDGSRRYLRATLMVVEQHEHRPYRVVGVIQDITERHRAEHEIAAHVAVQEALAEWNVFEPGAHGLLARLAAALDCHAGVFWVPRDEVLMARVFWHDSGGEPLIDAAVRARPLPRGSGLSGRAWEAAKPLSWTLESPATPDSSDAPSAGEGTVGALAIPALMGKDVLAVVELRADREIRLGERLLRSLYGISHELGHFLARRGGELAMPLLTLREIEVLQLAAGGLSARRTAEQLTVSPATIRTHLENIYLKLQVSDKSSAVAAAMRLGIID